MYASVRNVPAEAVAQPRSGRRSRVSSTVVLLGLVSLFTDLAQEMVVAVLPLYLTYELRLSPLIFGVMDGVYQGATALVRLLGGVVADRRGRYKEVAAAGYGLSAACKLGLLAAGGAWVATTAVLLFDRLGKGLRTAPRDALISLSSDDRALAMSFGVHRALDTIGAMLGPLAAFMLLAAAPGGFDAIFVISFCVSLVGLGILVLFVRNRQPGDPAPAPRERVTVRSALALLRLRRFRAIAVTGVLLGLLTVSDPFLYLVVQRKGGLAAEIFPLLFLGTAVSYLLLAVPVGRLADRVGRGRVFVAGHLTLLAVYALLRLTDLGLGEVLAALVLLGAYYAATDGVLMALAAPAVPAALRGSGFAVITSMTALARFASSLLFGAAWSAWGADAAVLVFLIALAAAAPVAAVVLRRGAATAA